MKVCDKTCIFFFFPVINKYFLMAKRSLLSRCTSYNVAVLRELSKLLNLNIFIYRNFLHFLKQLFYSCGLLYDAVSNTTCVVLEVRMTDE